MSVADEAQHLYDEACAWTPRAPVREAHAQGESQLRFLQSVAAFTDGASWLDRDPRDIAAHLGGLAQMAHVEEFPQASTWARVIAYGLAGWCAAARAEELDLSSGGDA